MSGENITWIVAISIFGAVVLIPAIGVTLAIIIRALRGGSSKKKDVKMEASETRMIQEIYHGLTKMETRIDSLETILLSKEEHQAEAKKLSDFERKIERG